MKRARIPQRSATVKDLVVVVFIVSFLNVTGYAVHDWVLYPRLIRFASAVDANTANGSKLLASEEQLRESLNLLSDRFDLLKGKKGHDRPASRTDSVVPRRKSTHKTP